MNRGMAKAERLRKMERLYYLKAYSDQEMAEILGTDRTTIFRNRAELETEIPFLKDEHGRWKIDRTRYLSEIRVNVNEALILYLAARRMSQQTRLAQPFTASALQKLGLTLRQPMTEKLVETAQVILTQKANPEKVKILETIAQGWVEKIKVRIRYQGLHARQTLTHWVSPYLLEPSPWSDSTYLIAYSDVFEDVATFKIERIEQATLGMSKDMYTIPENFDEQKLLKHAWGIWSREGEPNTVKLKFAPGNATRRLKESIWHPLETVTDLDNGGCLWEAPIAEWQEMLPWVRGWGADCEVLEPERLLDEIKKHLYLSTRTYKIMIEQKSSLDRLLRLWGKTTKNSEIFHPALYHMLDVAHVAQQLLSPRATPRWRKVLGCVLGADADSLYEWLPFLIALHDLGKLSIPFQILNEKQVTRLKDEGFELGKADRKDGQALHHTLVGRIMLDELSFAKNWPDNLHLAFLEMVGGHHGFYEAEGMKDRQRLLAINEDSEWHTLRETAMQWLESYLCLQWPNPLPNPGNVSAAVVALNGFCILCDWLGSDEKYFTAKPHTPLDEYVKHSRKKAFERVRDAGFFQKAISQAPTTFVELFAFPPRPLQAAIDHIPDALLANPTLTIIEAPTGEGKTEAGLTLARRIAALRGFDEMYIALPTTATSNAMYVRITEHLEHRLGLDPKLAKLIHGQSFLLDDDLSVESLSNGDGERPAAMDWFTPKKKALLAPFGVGTIDQAELSALNVRHNALRLIGLAGKVIILDEVHAYDTYMTTIIKRMLEWLAALGSSVILLSATLPIQKRQELAAAYGREKASQISNLETYPSLLTIGTGLYSPSEPIGVYQPDKKISVSELQYTDNQALDKARWLLDKVQEGGCACWITNTVDRAQKIFKALQTMKSEDVQLHLLHARFPQEDRALLETEIRSHYSKDNNAPRPSKGVVVGTQVLEQSLDLDFDVMATDLAPIDLILQRAGRLHRHLRDQAERHTHTKPSLYINTIMTNADNGIYGEYILHMTKNALQNQLVYQVPLSLPDDYRPLVETVYAEEQPGKDSPLFDAWQKLDNKMIDLKKEAKIRLVNSPDPIEFITSNKDKFKEDEDSSAWVVAQTRWGQQSLTVIPLMRVENAVIPVLSSDLTPIPLDQPADRSTQLRLRQRSIRISNRDLVNALKKQREQERYKLFTQSALLKSCVPLWLEPIMENHQVIVNNDLPKPVYLHPVLGLVFDKYDVSTV